MNFSFKQIDYLHPPEVIAPSIGNPTVEKIQQILESYKSKDSYIIGYFIDDKLIAIIGIKVEFSKALIKHISVLEEFRSQGIAKKLVQHVIEYFSLKEISAETDEESVGFYRSLAFVCKAFTGNYGIRL
jgi:ribosomal protein S18 acetylase RimI-like enzyme